MISLTSIWASLLLGVLTTITAVCILPLYPGFLSFLASSSKNKNTPIPLLGVLVVAGIITFMMIIGAIFGQLVSYTLTDFIGTVAPIAFSLLIIIGILLIIDFDFSKYMPQAQSPTTKNPLLSAYLFGIFFGLIVLPCNPGLLLTFFSKQLLTKSVTQNILDFIGFGIGLGSPLLIFSLISIPISRLIISFLTNHKSIINKISGILLIAFSLYFLIYDFGVFT